MRRRTKIALGTAAAGLALAIVLALRPPPGPRSLAAFDPDRVADLETRMWQAYYAKEKVRLFALLVTTLREQYRYSWWTAAENALCFARAAARFGDTHLAPERRAEYDAFLPDLRDGYAIARDWVGGAFDPDDVARKELAWWVARRVPGEDDPANVGRLIGEEYVALYGIEGDARRALAMRAGELRARAGKLRDEGGDRADWGAVHALLAASWRELHDAAR